MYDAAGKNLYFERGADVTSQEERKKTPHGGLAIQSGSCAC